MSSSSGYLLDTNVLVALIRARPLGETIDRRFRLQSALNRSMISVVSVGEMLSLARQFQWGEPKRKKLRALLDEIVWIDINHPDVFEAYGAIDQVSRSVGKPMGKNDVWIAATAHVSGTTLLTTDLDFDHRQGQYLHRVWIDPQQQTN